MEDTEKLLWTVSIANLIGWSLVYFLPFRQILIGWGAIGMIITLIAYKMYPVLRDKRAWQVWALVTILGLTINYISFEQTLLIEYGFISIWFFLISISYLFTAVYNRENPMITRNARIVLFISGIVGLVSTFLIQFMSPIGYTTQATVGLALSVVPVALVAILYRNRRKDD